MNAKQVMIGETFDFKDTENAQMSLSAGLLTEINVLLGIKLAGRICICINEKVILNTYVHSEDKSFVKVSTFHPNVRVPKGVSLIVYFYAHEYDSGARLINISYKQQL